MLMTYFNMYIIIGHMDINLKKIRIDFGWSQVKLAHESDVSLPTIQNIEAGKANPTIEVLEKLTQVFGLKFKLYSPPFDPERAASFGVPLSTMKDAKSYRSIQPQDLKRESRRWHQQIINHGLTEREEISMIAFLKAIKDHYPIFYKNNISTPLFDLKIKKHSNEGRITKLRRIALSYLGQYL
jgi:transcriptional regulator with XRE-family HTH domain